MNPACHKNCKYKYDQSAADIRIGDAWGTKYAKDENGVSSVIVFSEKGQNMIDKLRDLCEIQEVPFEVAAESQMRKNCGKAFMAGFVKNLSHKKSVIPSYIWVRIFRIETLLRFPSRVFNYIKRKI